MSYRFGTPIRYDSETIKFKMGRFAPDGKQWRGKNRLQIFELLTSALPESAANRFEYGADSLRFTAFRPSGL